jgi:nucleoside-diphosphate-sugar epimerase
VDPSLPPLPARVWIVGCGFIGRTLASSLHDAGTEVLGLTHSPESARALAGSVPFPVAACDVASLESVRGLAATHAAPEAVVHCASSGRGGAEAYRRVYRDGCVHLLGAWPGQATTLLFTSSTSVYPQTEGEEVDETSPAEPDRETGRILRETEELVLAAGGIVARLAGLYGPGRSVLLQRFLDGTARIEEGVSRYLNQVHRDDVVSALVLLLRHRPEASGRVYNVADGEALTQRECYERLARRFGTEPPPEGPRDPDRKRGWTHKRIRTDRLRALGWRPRFPSFPEAVEADPDLLPSIRALVAVNGTGPSTNP